VTERDVAVALPNVEVPEVRVENTPVVNVGLGDTAMVLVPENVMLEPVVRNDTGLL
jgi:hypothetical protein